ncbi:MAG: hypothetical protein ABI539_08915 [Acidobacteriota bacterium]
MNAHSASNRHGHFIDPANDQARFNLGVVQLVKRNRPAVLSQYRILKGSNPNLADQLYKMLYRRLVVDASGRKPVLRAEIP